MAKKIPTMTLNELASAMRTYGMSVSNEFLAAGIEQGLYPFAICVRTESGHNRRFEIYKVLFDKWASERSVQEAG